MAEDEMLTDLVFIPFPVMGHLLPTVEMAQRVVAQTPGQISVTILIITNLLPSTDENTDSYLQSLKNLNNPLITLLEIPALENPPDVNSSDFMSTHLQSYKPVVKQALIDHYSLSSRPRLGGLVLDFFWSSLIDVGDDLRIPSYIFFSFGAVFVTTLFHFEAMHINVPATFGGDSPDETVVHLPGFQNPLPMKVWPAVLLDKDGPGRSEMLLGHARNFRRAKGILVNTFMELEQSIIQSMGETDHHVPPIFPVGPILAIKEQEDSNDILRWLDSQPLSSVVFLCFGSMGSFDEDQVKQIAMGLEQSGQRFLWSLRKPPNFGDPNNNIGRKLVLAPQDYDDITAVLPQGFLERTAKIGKVIGWAPQASVLAHKAVGAFVSHCGWNSTLESLWFGVPMLTWPMYAEQRLNAFLLVKELGLAVDVRMDYLCHPRQGGSNMVVMAHEIHKAINKMMMDEEGDKVRGRAKQISEAARKAVVKDGDGSGSSWKSLIHFIKDVEANTMSLP